MILMKNKHEKIFIKIKLQLFLLYFIKYYKILFKLKNT